MAISQYRISSAPESFQHSMDAGDDDWNPPLSPTTATPSNPKYGGLSPLNFAGARKPRVIPAHIRRPRRPSENWDNDFVLDYADDDIPVPKNIQSRSHNVCVDLYNIRDLSQKSKDLQRLLAKAKDIHSQNSTKVETDPRYAEFTERIAQAEALVELAGEMSTLQKQSLTSNHPTTTPAKTPSQHFLQTILLRHQQVDLESDVTDLANAVTFDLTIEDVPCLIDHCENLTKLIQSYIVIWEETA